MNTKLNIRKFRIVPKQQNKRNGKIHAWYITPNHVHLIFKDIKAQKPKLLLGDFKRVTSRNVIKTIDENLKRVDKKFVRLF